MVSQGPLFVTTEGISCFISSFSNCGGDHRYVSMYTLEMVVVPALKGGSWSPIVESWVWMSQLGTSVYRETRRGGELVRSLKDDMPIVRKVGREGVA